MILQLLNVLIGLTLIYLIFSTVASALFELVETVLKRRSQLLRLGVQQILIAADKAADRGKVPDDTRVKTFYEHALIYGLYGGNYDKASRNLPSYIPPERFAHAVLMLAAGKGAELSDAERKPFENLKKLAEQLVGQDTVLDAQARAKAVEAALIQQYNDTMDRVTGWFRRYSKQWLIGIGFFLAAFANADTVQMIRVLAMDPVLAEQIANSAAEVVKQRSAATADDQAGDDPCKPIEATSDPKPAAQDNDLGIDRQLCVIKANRALAESLGLPIGWAPGEVDRLGAASGFEWFKKLFGLFLTGLAISFGAPFWFDLLNKLVSLRSSLKPKRKDDAAAPGAGGAAGQQQVKP